MSKTAASLLMASTLVVVSIGMAATRLYVLGPDEIDGIRGAGAFRVTLQARGRLTDKRRPVVLALPPDFRRQHIFQEKFRSKQLNAHLTKRKLGAPRKAVWRPDGPNPTEDFRLSYSFACQLPVLHPTAAMQRLTKSLDAAPPALPGPARAASASGPGDIARAAQELISPGMTEREKVRACFDFASHLGDDAPIENKSARDCLRDGSGDSAGKARLLAALCQSIDVPARVLIGIVVATEDPTPPLHFWTEAWVDKHWQAMDPARHLFGDPALPPRYLVLSVGDRKLVTGSPTVDLSFRVLGLANLAGMDDVPLSPARRFWHRLSLHGLRPGEQQLVKFLLLLPLAALIVTIYRTIIGIPTFGTFSPALLGLAFLDVRALRWGLPIFLVLVLMGWGMRHWLERFHLLQVPRISALLTMIVILLIFLVVGANNWGIGTTQYIALYPLVILTHLVERFWTVEAEDGSASSFRTLLGTLFVAVTVSLGLGAEAVAAWMLRYPETLGVVLAIQFVLGRYTGYRIVELYRFGDLVPASAAPAPAPAPAAAPAAPSAAARSEGPAS